MKRYLQRHRPSPAMVVAIIALIVATAGSATAATVIITSSAQIKKGVVNGGDVKDGSLTSKDIKTGGIKLSNLDKATANAVGNANVRALEVYRRTGPVDQAHGTPPKRVATIQSLEPGVWVILSKTTITAEPPPSGLLQPGKSNSAHCTLDVGGDKDDARIIVGGPGFNSPATLNNQLTHTFAEPGPVALDCDVAETQWGASDTSIIAIKVSQSPKQSVDG